MQRKWEYKAYNIEMEKPWASQFDPIGAGGWELVQIIHGQSIAGATGIFKRPVEHGEGP